MQRFFTPMRLVLPLGLGLAMSLIAIAAGVEPAGCSTYGVYEYEPLAESAEGDPIAAVRAVAINADLARNRVVVAEAPRFAAIAAAANGANTVAQLDEWRATVESRVGGQTIGTFEVSRVGSGWRIESLRVTVPAEFCRTRQ